MSFKVPILKVVSEAVLDHSSKIMNIYVDHCCGFQLQNELSIGATGSWCGRNAVNSSAVLEIRSKWRNPMDKCPSVIIFGLDNFSIA